jgi:hypothetical protein
MIERPPVTSSSSSAVSSSISLRPRLIVPFIAWVPRFDVSNGATDAVSLPDHALIQATLMFRDPAHTGEGGNACRDSALRPAFWPWRRRSRLRSRRLCHARACSGMWSSPDACSATASPIASRRASLRAATCGKTGSTSAASCRSRCRGCTRRWRGPRLLKVLREARGTGRPRTAVYLHICRRVICSCDAGAAGV